MTRYFLIILPLLYLGCAGSKSVVEEESIPVETAKYDESFDPLSLNDDDIVIASPEITSSTETGDIQESNIALPQEITGFRVQILATKNIETASLFEQEASERFQSQNHKTYLIFEAPLYKIRVGNCRSRAEAEALRDLAMGYGYRESFIVKSKIQIIE
jgi:hypothetical protein